MEIKEIIGIDVSKLTLDAHIHVKGSAERFANMGTGIKEMLVWAKGNLAGSMENVLFVFEHTGLYSDTLEGHLDGAGQAGLKAQTLAYWADRNCT